MFSTSQIVASQDFFFFVISSKLICDNLCSDCQPVVMWHDQNNLNPYLSEKWEILKWHISKSNANFILFISRVCSCKHFLFWGTSSNLLLCPILTHKYQKDKVRVLNKLNVVTSHNFAVKFNDWWDRDLLA